MLGNGLGNGLGEAQNHSKKKLKALRNLRALECKARNVIAQPRVAQASLFSGCLSGAGETQK